MTLVAVFLMALAPRLAYLAWSPPVFAGEYWEISSSLLDHGTFALDGIRTTRFEPLYPLFIAGARAITGSSPAAVQVLQIAMASLGGVLLFLLARDLTGHTRIAWIAAILYAAHPLLVRHAADHSDSALMTTAVLLFAYTFTRAVASTGSTGSPGSAAVVLAGACLAIAVMTRVVALPIMPLAAVVLLAHGQRRAACLFVLACAVVLSPMIVRDYDVGGSLAPSRHGSNLFLGNSEYTAALMPDHSPDLLQRYTDSMAAREMPSVPLDSPHFGDAADAMLEHLAWENIRRHPLQTLALKLRNVCYFFSPFLVPSHLLLPETTIAFGPSGQVTVDHAPLRPLAERVTFSIASFFVLATALVGLVVRGAGVRRDAILWCITATFVAVHSVYFPATRYTAPVLFVLLFYSAVAIDGGLTALDGRGAR